MSPGPPAESSECASGDHQDEFWAGQVHETASSSGTDVRPDLTWSSVLPNQIFRFSFFLLLLLPSYLVQRFRCGALARNFTTHHLLDGSQMCTIQVGESQVGRNQDGGG
ncbi:hypothetical protein V2G26_002974 [Clonostachys chloroleuca]